MKPRRPLKRNLVTANAAINAKINEMMTVRIVITIELPAAGRNGV